MTSHSVDTVKDYLKLMGHTLPQAHSNSGMGAVERFVLEHGQQWPNTMPYDEVEQAYPGHGSPKNCFEDAALLAHENADLTYVEGYALNAFLPTHHAWCVTEDGTVIDTTWAVVNRLHATQQSGRDYFGFAVGRRELAGWLIRTGTYGILCDDDATYELLQNGMDVLSNPSAYLTRDGKSKALQKARSERRAARQPEADAASHA